MNLDLKPLLQKRRIFRSPQGIQLKKQKEIVMTSYKNKFFQKPLRIFGALVFILLVSSYGYAQYVGCKVNQAFCNSKFAGPQPNCFATKVNCPNPKDPSKSIEGYVPSSAKINYIEVDVIAPNGNTQPVKIPVQGEVADVNSDIIHQTGVLMYLINNGYMKDSARLSFVGAGISTDTKFGNTADEIITVSGSLYQKIDAHPLSNVPLIKQCKLSHGTLMITY